MSDRRTAVAPAHRVGTAVPILRVRTLDASVDYYVRVLGFKLAWKDEGIIACVSRDACQLMLCEGDQGNEGGWVWIGADDAERLCEELRGRGAHIRQEPTNHPWAYEVQVADPDGNVLRFGSSPRTDKPYGPWCDMRGDLWVRTAAGGWERDGRGRDGGGGA